MSDTTPEKLRRPPVATCPACAGAGAICPTCGCPAWDTGDGRTCENAHWLSVECPCTIQEEEPAWRKKVRNRLLVLSATQIETAKMCLRKWWLTWCRQLEVPGTPSQIKGSVLHGVAERYLRADDLGRDPATNLPVVLYPEGWTKAKSRFDDTTEGEISPADADVIQRLVAAAIEQGVLERVPDRQIEIAFREDLLEVSCPTCHGKPRWTPNEPCDVCGAPFGSPHLMAVHEQTANRLAENGEEPDVCRETLDPPPWECPDCHGDGKGTRVQVTGFIDLLHPLGVQDHKTTKTMKYAKSPEALKKNPQMLLYAHYLLSLYRDAKENLPASVSVRHNVFCLDPDDLRVRKTEAFVTPDDVAAFWFEIQQLALVLVTLRHKAGRWSDCPNPPTGNQACNAYGGCPFRDICGGREDENSYQNRLDRWKKMQYTTGGSVQQLPEAVVATATPI